MGRERRRIRHEKRPLKQSSAGKVERIAKKKLHRKRQKTKLAFVVAGFFLFSLIVILSLNWPFAADNPAMRSERFQANSVAPRAAIVDGLYNTSPNPAFTEQLTGYLDRKGFAVDLFRGKNVTIDLLTGIGGYKLLILRLHSTIHTDRWLYLFSGEIYNESRYTVEQLSRAVRKGYTFNENEPPYFTLNSAFLGRNNPGGLNGSTIVLMGCNGTGDSYSIRRFFERGAEAYVAWSGYIDLSYSDRTILMIMQSSYMEGLNLKDAVKKFMKESGPDPVYGSTLECFVPEQKTN